MAIEGFLFSFWNTLGSEGLSQFVEFLKNHNEDQKEEKELSTLVHNYLCSEKSFLETNKDDISYNFEDLYKTIIYLVLDKVSLKDIFSVDTFTHENAIKKSQELCFKAAQPKNKQSLDRVKLVINNSYSIVCQYYALLVNPGIYMLMHDITMSFSSSINQETSELKEYFDGKFNELYQHCDKSIIHDQTDSLNNTNQKKDIQSDNFHFLEMLKTKLFLEDSDSNISLDDLYIEPFVCKDKKTFSEYLKEWLKSNNYCLLLFGEAGIGKSSLVARLIKENLNISGDNSSAEFTVLAFALRNHCDIFSKYSYDYPAKKIICDLFGVDQLSDLNGNLLVLDGFDELTVLAPGFDKITAAKFISDINRSCRSEHVKFHILITSRDGYFETKYFETNLLQETLCWDETQVKQWCDLYGKLRPDYKANCDLLFEQYSKLPRENKNDNRYAILCIPFILYLCCVSKINLSENRTSCQIYDKSFRILLERKHGEDLIGGDGFQSNLEEKKQRIVLWQYTKELAYQMFLLKSLTLSEEKDSSIVLYNGLQRAKQRTIRYFEEKNKTILADNDKYTVDESTFHSKKYLAVFSFANSDNHNGITFAHKSVCEYFAALKLYEDYFAHLNDTYLAAVHDENSQMEIVMENTMEAFRYAVITPDVFSYLIDLCRKSPVPFENNDNPNAKGFNYEVYKYLFFKSINQGYEESSKFLAPVEEYNHTCFNAGREKIRETKSDLIMQIARAYNNITWFLTGMNYRNSNRWRSKALFVPSDRSANMERWDLSDFDLSEAFLIEANLREANLSDSWLVRADMSRCDLTNANLSHAVLNNANLRAAVLVYADLQQANLRGANLRGARFRGANLSNAILCDAHIFATNFYKTIMVGSKLNGADLTHAILYKTDLSNADLAGANLKEAETTQINLSKANLFETDLRGARLTKANLSEATICFADLGCANLENSDLSKANLKGSYLDGVNLSGANLSEADLRGANLRQANLNNAVFDGALYCELPNCTTLFPDGFDPVQHGMIKVDNLD